MKSKNSVYTLTPPDLQLTRSGPSVLMLGIPFDSLTPYTKIYDNMFPDIELVFFTSEEGINSGNLAWYRAVAGVATSVFVDVDNVSKEELFLAMQIEADKRALVFWISQNTKNIDLCKLLNSYQYHIFNNLNELENFLETEYNRNG